MRQNITYLSKVFYQGEIYQVIWIYESGLSEIKSQDDKVKLVKLSDLKLVETENKKETDRPE